jgi:hypothetical protein
MPFHAPRHMTRGVCVEQRPRWFALLSPKASPVAASFELTQAGRSWISPRPRSVVTRVSMWKVVDTDRPAGKVWKVVDTHRPAGGKVVDTHRPAGKGVESRGHRPTGGKRGEGKSGEGKSGTPTDLSFRRLIEIATNPTVSSPTGLRQRQRCHANSAEVHRR